jgi:hypothetical protein
MKCYSLMLGARNTPFAGRTFRPEDDELIRSITFRHFTEGFTVLHADGGWFDPKRQKFIAEESRQILVCTDREESLRPWCDELLAALGQKELLVVEVGAATTYRVASSSGRRGE